MKKAKFLSVSKIQKAQRAFASERKWNKFHTPKNLVMALAGEVGELLELFQWLTEKEAVQIMRDRTKAQAVRNELADVLFYLIRIADILKIDLESAFWEKLELSRSKYPVELSKGSAKKYTEFKSQSQL